MSKKKKNKNTPTLDEIFRGIDPPSEEKLVSGKIPKELQLKRDEPGICFGKRSKKFPSHYVGVAQAADSNIVVIGGAGANKTVGVAMTTIQTWKGAMVVTDVKGELSAYYKELYLNGLTDRPPLVFDPTDVEGISYDPYQLIEDDGEENVVANISSIAYSIIPYNPNQADQFWDDRERAILEAGLLYGYRIGLSFSEAMGWIANSTVTELCEELLRSNCSDPIICMLIGNMLDLKPETLSCFDCGLRNKVLPFVTDLRVCNAFRGKREGAACFTWHDLSNSNIFLKVPIEYTDLCRPIVNLMISQLLRYLQRQPEKHSDRGSYPDILLLLDEFPVFGHIRGIADGVATLRSKRCHFCLLIQSISQLDKVYGEHYRRIIFDNCQYKVILQACDPETQRFLADMIGTELHIQRSSSKQYDEYMDLRGYTKSKSSTREYAVQPYNLANLEKCVLISPYGVNEVDKIKYYDLPKLSEYITEDYVAPVHMRKIAERVNELVPANIRCTALSVEERLENVNTKIAAAKRPATAERESEVTEDASIAMQREIGQRVLKYFPALSIIQPGSEEENALRYKPLEAFLHTLADENDVMNMLREKSNYDQQLTDALSTQSSDR